MNTLPNAHGLVIGIANYARIRALPESVLNDARDLHGLLVDRSTCAYPPENVERVLDGEATQERLLEAFKVLAGRANEDSTVVVYVSAHGGRINSGGQAGVYLLPVDVDTRRLAETAISSVQLSAILQQIRARKMVVIFDTCHAAGIAKEGLEETEEEKEPAPELTPGLTEKYYTELAAGRGRVVFAACRPEERSYIKPGAKNSVFTHHLLAGLRGAAPGPGGLIRVFDLFHYLQPLVTADQPSQHPVFKAEVEDNFPVALYQGGQAPALPQPLRPAADGFAYDLFVSYRHQEPVKQWVRRRLVPALEAQGLRACVDYRDFRLGRALLNEMERAVTQSRYTLAVLSPGYAEGGFTDLERVMAQQLGVEESQTRFMAVMRESCNPRLAIRTRMWLDMTDDVEFDASIQRLVYEVRQAPDL